MGKTINWCSPNQLNSKRKRRAGDIKSFQPSIIQSIVNTAAHVEPTHNPYLSLAIGTVSPTDPGVRPADHSPDDNLDLDEENSNFLKL